MIINEDNKEIIKFILEDYADRDLPTRDIEVKDVSDNVSKTCEVLGNTWNK